MIAFDSGMPLLFEQGRDVRELRTARGTLVLWTLAPTVYVTRFTGHLESAHVDLLFAYSEPLVLAARQPIDVFHEWTAMTAYDSVARSRITTWALERRRVFGRVHVSVRSQLVAMGVQVANIALGNITAYRGALELETALHATLRAHGVAMAIPPRE